VKVRPDTLKAMTTDMDAVLASWTEERRNAFVAAVNDPTRRNRTLHDLWFEVCFQRRNDDRHPIFDPTHPQYAEFGRKRVLTHDFDYPLYPDDTNDDTLTTALKAAPLAVLKNR
jgi:hypothetical protein